MGKNDEEPSEPCELTAVLTHGATDKMRQGVADANDVLLMGCAGGKDDGEDAEVLEEQGRGAQCEQAEVRTLAYEFNASSMRCDVVRMAAHSPGVKRENVRSCFAL